MVATGLPGRQEGERRKALVEGRDLAGAKRESLELLGARRHGSHLFLRDALGA